MTDAPQLTHWTVLYHDRSGPRYVNDQSGRVRAFLDANGIPWRWVRKSHEPPAMTAPTIDTSYARQKLAKLDACKRIHVYQADDETAICIHDGVRLTESDGGRLIHDAEEIRLLRTMAGYGWPK